MAQRLYSTGSVWRGSGLCWLLGKCVESSLIRGSALRNLYAALKGKCVEIVETDYDETQTQKATTRTLRRED